MTHMILRAAQQRILKHLKNLCVSRSQQLESIIMEAHGNEKLGKCCKLTSAEFELKEETMYRKYIGCLKKHQLAIE